MIEVRPLRDDEIDLYVEIRTRVHPQTPMPREVVVDDRKGERHLDLVAELDGVPAGVASTDVFGGAPNGDLAYLTIRVPREHRRQGLGTALHRAASGHARTIGKSRFYCVVRADDGDSLGYYGARGFAEVGRMQDVELELDGARLEPAELPGIEIALLTPEHERGTYEVALEADADIPSGEQHSSGTFEQWSERHLSGRVLRDLSFVALEDGRVVGYAILGKHADDTAENWMTGIARSARGRGIASALKQRQLLAARDAGWRRVRTQNDLANAPMRHVNGKLGYTLKFEWVHMTGPLLG